MELQGASVYHDANKDPYRMLLLARRFDVKPIYIFKNGVAGVFSYVKNAVKRGKTRTVREASERWFREQIAISRALKAGFGDAFFQIGYSELCRDVPNALRRITEYLGTSYEPVEDLASYEHHVIGNAMRLSVLTEVREDESWRNGLSESDLAAYRAVYDEFAPSVENVNPRLLEQIWR
jgi:hypothetical protein